MKDYQCKESEFLDYMKNHEINIIRDDGVSRHIRFKRPGTGAYRFDLVTWPGVLVITGDCGTYVFQRTEDMFEFFRMDPRDFNYNKTGGLSINPGYWSEKLIAVDCHGRNGGSVMEFSEDLFRQQIKEWFDEEEFITKDLADDCWREIESEVLIHVDDGEQAAMRAAMEFYHKDSDFQFNDFFEVNCRVFTWHFIWNLYAIAWGIALYDKTKAEEPHAI